MRNLNKKNLEKKAFSLVEVIIVMVIFGFIVTMGYANYANYTERNRGKNAEITLSVIYNAQKRYKLHNLEYYGCESCDAATINEELGIYIDDPYFDYSITSEGDSFTAVATRNSRFRSACVNMTMEVTDASSTPLKECAVWR